MLYELILSDVCTLCGVTLEDAYSPTRRADVVRARSITWYILSKHYGWTLTSIAKHSQKHHATVLHGIASIEDAYLMYSDVRSVVNDIQQINYASLMRGL
jgi:chromosomal replication initiation ATPase DnaA